MKLLNQSIKYLFISILLIVGAWSVVFYANMLDEIEDSIDDGLANYKLLIIQKADADTTILSKKAFDESNYAISEISGTTALSIRDRYTDTLMYMQDEDDLEPVRMLTTAFWNRGRYYQLKVVNSMVEEDDLIEDLFWSAFWLFVLLIVAIAVINNLVLRKLWKPFYSLLEQVKEFRLGHSRRLPDIRTDTKEFNDLKNTLNTLLRHSIETYEQQKQFAENASHELQTPIAIATSKLELLLEKGSLAEAEAAHIAQVLETMERLAKLNRSLLLLVKIENRQFSDDQPVSMNEIARQCVSDLEEFARYRSVSIKMEDTAQLTVDMDATLAVIIISNLVKNAILHNRPNGTAVVAIGKDVLRITNTGSETPLDQEKVFNRFYKSDTGSKGTGLGLSIVKAIGSLYGFSTRYRFENGQHCFELHFSKNKAMQ